MIQAVLESHPLTPSQTVREMTAQVTQIDSLLTVSFVIVGHISHIRLPAMKDARRADELWQHTCLELFAKTPGNAGYIEFNFSPSTQWAAYRFSTYREGMTSLDVHSPPSIRASSKVDRLQIDVNVDSRDLPAPDTVLALSAVIEDIGGTKSYWALQHRPDKPDFHHEHGFVLSLNE